MVGVDFSVLEFDQTFFNGPFAKEFTKCLIDSNNDKLFAIYPIKVLLLFTW